MVEGVRRDVEILVHTSAPSRGKDDAGYRALASAYLSFEPASFRRLHDNADVAQSSALIVISPEISFESVLDNADSPTTFREGPFQSSITSSPPKPQPLTADNDESWHTPPCIIPDSQSPYSRAIPEHSSPARILELWLQAFDTSGSTQSQPLLDSSAPFLTTSSPVRIVLATPPIADIKSSSKEELKRKRPLESLRTSPHRRKKPRSHTCQVENSPLSSAEQPQSSKSPTRKSIQLSALSKRKYADQTASSSPAKYIKTPNPTPAKKTFRQLINPNEIHPPPPLTSSNGLLTPVVTPPLQALATQVSLVSRYKPRTQTRALRDLERGYWCVPMAKWDKALQEEAWTKLRQYVEKRNLAGWGVWCSRDELREIVGADGEWVGKRLELRAYCWGEIVEHVYYLLYLVSNRKIKGLGAKWVDAGGKAVVVMPGNAE